MARTTIAVAGALANKPGNGGEAWVRLSWVQGLRRLGFDVVFVEELAPGVDAGAGRAAFAAAVELAGLRGRAALVVPGEPEPVGLRWDELHDLADDAVLLVNVSGHLTGDLLGRFRRRAWIDVDPGFTQVWHAAGLLGDRLLRHEHHFTVGEQIGARDCPIPTGGLRWRPLPPPVVLEDWPVAGDGAVRRFTTVATWRPPHGPLEHAGRVHGVKAHEFRRVVALPRHAPAAFELALAIDPADHRDRDALVEHGWALADPRAVAGDPLAFRAYVQGSDAEFSVAQGVYVDLESGWVSDRTVRYLASGRPALVQETGLSRTYPGGVGLVPFRTLRDAVDGVRRIVADPAGHRAAARALAEERFDSDVVLARFLAQVGVGG